MSQQPKTHCHYVETFYRTLVFHKGPTCFARRADAEKRCHPINACGALRAGGRGAVINVLRAVRPTPAVYTHTDIAAKQVGAGASVLASVGLQAAFVDVIVAVLAYEVKEGNSRDQESSTTYCK